MSFKLYPLVWACEEVGGTEKLVLLLLAEHAADDGSKARPSLTRISRKCGISEDTARRSINSLRKKGFIHIVSEANPRRQTARVYRLNLHRLTAAQDAGAEDTPLENEPPRKVQPGSKMQLGGKLRLIPSQIATPPGSKNTTPTYPESCSEPVHVPSGDKSPSRAGQHDSLSLRGDDGKNLSSPRAGKKAQRSKKSGEVPSKRKPPEPVEYAFEGRAFRLTRRDYEAWRGKFSNIPHFDAALRRADDYFARNPPRSGNAFWAARTWLEQDNARAPAAIERDELGLPKNISPNTDWRTDDHYRGVNY